MLAIAHRGASAYAPENTRAAFDRAIAMGADMIETDVQLTRDSELVLIHDDLVDRTTSAQGPVADYNLAGLLRLDAGSWFGEEFAGERIATLRDFCDEYVPGIPVCLEIKDPFATAPLIDFLRNRPEVMARVQVTSFYWHEALLATTLLDSPVGFLAKAFNRDIIDRCASHGMAQVCPSAGDLDAALVAYAHERGLVVRAWGIRERGDVDRLFATGADGATTNWPDWIIDHPQRQTAS